MLTLRFPSMTSSSIEYRSNVICRLSIIGARPIRLQIAGTVIPIRYVCVHMLCSPRESVTVVTSTITTLLTIVPNSFPGNDTIEAVSFRLVTLT